jgi:hemoglobin/transferrin/lactoferrin receptor protein
MRIVFVISFICLIHFDLFAQQNNITDTTKKISTLEEVILSTNNFEERKKNVVQNIDVISAKQIAQTNAQNTGDLLASTGKIFVQKSQQGGSSPVIRGFEASRILLVVDGVRLNNLIYRSGHLQNAITIDQNSLKQIEVSYGPSSTIYGSDALGGAIHFITKSPVFSISNKIFFTGSAFTRYSTVNNEKAFHVDMSLGNKKVAWLQAFNYSSFGDLKMGNNYSKVYPNFGRRSNYIENINGIDSVVKNSDDRVQKFSGYNQWDITQKFAYKISDFVAHKLNFQFSTSTNVPRYDRLQDVRNFGGSIGTTLRWAEWYYGPQQRFLAAYELNIIKKYFFDEIKFNLNYQDVEESRITREYRRYDRLDSRLEKVKVYGSNLSGRKKWNAHELVMGLDVQLNTLRSVATRQNIFTKVISALDTRYPDGDNSMNNFAAYAQHIYKKATSKFIFNSGIRLQNSQLKSNIVNNSFFELPFTNFAQNNTAIIANTGFIFNASKSTAIKFAVATGFRTPNIDDLAKLFESSTASKQVVVPNANLKPEYTYNADFTVAQKVGTLVNFEANFYYTLFRNAIIKAPFLLNGQDSINYNGVQSQVLASQNVNSANLYGFSFSGNAAITKAISVTSTISYANGYFKTDNNKPSRVYEKQANGTYVLVSKNVSRKPLDHIPPVIGKASINYNNKKIALAFFALYNGWKRLHNYNTDGEDNEQYATADGMPAWFTLNATSQYQISKCFSLQVATENILDRNYRTFASGFSAGGRNFLIALRATW